MELTVEYINKLKNSVFKILYLFEEKNTGLTPYIGSLIYEVYGLQYLTEEDKHPAITSLNSILEHFYDDSIQPNPDISVIRREVFHCLDLIEKTFEVGESE